MRFSALITLCIAGALLVLLRDVLGAGGAELPIEAGDAVGSSRAGLSSGLLWTVLALWLGASLAFGALWAAWGLGLARRPAPARVMRLVPAPRPAAVLRLRAR